MAAESIVDAIRIAAWKPVGLVFLSAAKQQEERRTDAEVIEIAEACQLTRSTLSKEEIISLTDRVLEEKMKAADVKRWWDQIYVTIPGGDDGCWF